MTLSINLPDSTAFVKQECYAGLSQKVLGHVVEGDPLLAHAHENAAFQKVTILMPMCENEALSPVICCSPPKVSLDRTFLFELQGKAGQQPHAISD